MSAAERGRMLNRLPTRSSKMPTELALLECLDNGNPYQVAKATDLPLTIACYLPYAQYLICRTRLEEAGRLGTLRILG